MPTLRALFAATAAALAIGPGCAARPGGGEPARLEAWAFTAFWDPRSAESLARRGTSLDVAVTSWNALDSVTGIPAVLHAAAHQPGRAPARTMALLTSWHGDRFHPGAVRRLAGDSVRLAAAMGDVARRVAALGHRGIVLDFEALEAADLPLLLGVVRELSRASASAGAGPITVAIPATDTLAYPARALVDAGADAVMPMLYDQHWAGGGAGPVAAPDWVRRWLEVRVAEVGAQRVVAALPLYGYWWTKPGAGETVTLAEARARVVASGGTLARDSATGTLRARGPSGEVWVTDAPLVGRLLEEVRGARVGRVAFWYLGQEDPALWPLLDAPPR